MGDFKNSHGAQVFRQNRQLHFDFRDFYTYKQNKTMERAVVLTLLYSLLALFVFDDFFLKVGTHAKVAYTALLVLSAINYVIIRLINSKKVIKNDRARSGIGEIMSIMVALGFIGWGYMALVLSILEGRQTNYFVILIVYACCSMFMYYSLQHYVALYIICVFGAFYVAFALKGGNYDASILLNVILLGFLLTMGGIIKYFSAQKQFIAEREANQLRQTLEANNEELIATNEDLIKTTEKLRDYIESQRMFTASMNHELRSPLNGIIGLLQILKSRRDIPDSAMDEINDAYASSETLIQIVNDLLDYARIEAGEFKIEKGTFDLRNIILNIEGIERSFADSKGLDFKISVDRNMPCMLVGDGFRIQQIAVNLVSNGIKYTESGYVSLDVHMDMNQKLYIVVSDSGQGIEKSAQEALFRPFVRVNEKKNKYIQGTGLGLTIVKNLVQQMGGEIMVSSDFGKGSVFTVKIPVEIADHKTKFGELVERERVTVDENDDFTGVRLLCVDDNAVNLVVFKGLFNKTNAVVKTLSDGAAALDEVQKVKYDIIFLDHMMPGMDGIEVYEKMKEIPSELNLNADTPVIMLTANAGSEAENNYLSMGFSGYLPKPVLKDDLHKLTQSLIKNRK